MKHTTLNGEKFKMAKVSKHEFAGKIIKSISVDKNVLLLDLGKGPFDVREYLKLDDKFKLNMSEEMRDRIEKKTLHGTFVQDMRVYGPDINIPTFTGVKVLRRTTVSMPVGYEADAVEQDAGLLFTYYK